ncbi:MAG: hypothetical protein ACYC3O_03260 [Burkholderiales bacterium]
MENIIIQTPSDAYESERVTLITRLTDERATLTAKVSDLTQRVRDLKTEHDALLDRFQHKAAEQVLLRHNETRHEISVLQQQVAKMDRRLEEARQGRSPELAGAVVRRQAAELSQRLKTLAHAEQKLKAVIADHLRDVWQAVADYSNADHATSQVLAALGVQKRI